MYYIGLLTHLYICSIVGVTILLYFSSPKGWLMEISIDESILLTWCRGLGSDQQAELLDILSQHDHNALLLLLREKHHSFLEVLISVCTDQLSFQ